MPQETELYINEKEGLARLQGNAKVYYKLLTSFADKSMLGDIEDALRDGDIEQAARAAHTLKGISANLSMTALYNTALTLEKKLKANEEHAGEMEQMRLVYGKTLEAVRELTKD